MALNRRVGRALIVAGALSFPALALAEQPTELCDGDKHEKMEEPTADKSDVKQSKDKSTKKAPDKAEPKPEAKETDKPS